MRQKIVKTGKGKFNINWDYQKYAHDVIKLDFNPIINHFNLERFSAYTLIHWQSRPKGLRRWGFYCGKSDQYYGCDHDKAFFDNGTIELLQLDELQLLNPPSAVILLADTQVNFNGIHINCEKI